MIMHMIGCSHHQTPLHLRQRLAFSPEQANSALRSLKQRYPNVETVLLSTCNRVELYAAGDDPSLVPDVSFLQQFLLDFHHLNLAEYADHLKNCSDTAAVEHLFTVASSLDSLVVGESQILSQVKQAYEMSRTYQFAGPIVHAAFQHASLVARRVTNETEIHSRRVSVPSVAISEVAAEFFERFDDKDILIIGTGEMGEEALRYLQDAGATQVRIINRSIENARELAAKFEKEFMGSLRVSVELWDNLPIRLMTADLVISTTSAAEPIVTLAMFKPLHAQRKKQGTQLILDLAVPRDFEEPIGNLSNVYLYSVDDLQAACDRNVDFRRQQWPIARKIIAEETSRFLGDLHHRHAGPVIAALRAQANQIKIQELDRLKNRLLTQGVPDVSIDEISQSFERLVNKLLHPPLQSLREESAGEQQASLLIALKRLFNIRD